MTKIIFTVNKGRMSVLAIGQSSFFATEVKKSAFSKEWVFLGYRDALDHENWPEDVQTVINFASDPKVKEGNFSDFDHNLAALAQGGGAAYITLSSRAVYGAMPRHTVFSEDCDLKAEMLPYARGKKQIEDDLLAHFNHVTILRLSNVFGLEYGSGARRDTFFGEMLKSLKEEGRITLDIASQTERDFLPVSVLAEYLGMIVQNPQAGVFNLGSGIGTAVGDIASWVIEGFGGGDVIANEEEVMDSFVLDMAKTRSVYSLPDVTSEIIRQACIDIGQRLKNEA